MKDNNRGITLIELVVAIAISGVILFTIYSFYVTGVRGFSRGSSTATNQMSVRRVSNEVAREIRKAQNIDIPDPSTLVLEYEEGSNTVEVKIEYNSANKSIEADYTVTDVDGNFISSTSRNLADRISKFEVKKVDDKTTVTIESVENSDGDVDKLETVITERK